MSHITTLYSRFQNLRYLLKALETMKLLHLGTETYDKTSFQVFDTFSYLLYWNGESYNLINEENNNIIFSSNFFKKLYFSFLQKLNIIYLEESIISEMDTLGYQPSFYKYNQIDRSKTIIFNIK
uniref:Uncharacterized protein n=1 Tax=Astrosyne radiata TaxID=1158023 RepID=A0A2U9NT83_9STRA|nr:hypothetical protein ycf35 [Astrosyne radiata]AWT40341.1 hypothetical protein ycf35 [Astrosyne radiata]